MSIKKWICILLAAVLFLQAAPLAALAEGNQALTATETAAALALAGSRSPEVGDHSGNTSLENMTALQLGDEVDDMLDTDVKTLETSCEDIESSLYSLQQKDPAKYQELTSGDAAGYPDQIHDIFRQTENLRRQLEVWQDTLASQSSTIVRNTDALNEPDITDYDTRFFTHQIREATDDIRNIRQAISEQSGTYQAWLTEQLNLLAAEDGIGGWAKKVLLAEDPKITHTSVSVSGRFQTRNTLLSRLSPISSATAEEGAQKASLRVQDDKTIAVCAKLGEGKWLYGATVTVTDTRKKASYTGTTGNDGCFNLPISGFQLENDELAISVTISAEGYRTFIADLVYLKKGGVYEVTMVKDDGSPYIAGCSFAEHECLITEYTALYNRMNELKVPVRVHLENPSDTKCQVFLVYQSIDGNQYYASMEVQGEAGETDKYYIPAHGEGTLEITAPWRQKWKPGGAKFTWKHGNKTTKESDKKLLQLVISNSSVAKSDFTEGSPDLDAGSLNLVVPTQLEAEASKVDQPIVNPLMLSSFYSGINSVFNFNFDMSGGKYFKTGQVGLDLPFAYLLPRVSVARDGSTTIILGTDLGDFQKDKGPLLLNKDKLDSEEIQKTLKYSYKDLNAFTKKVATGAFHAANADREGGVKVGNIKGTITPIAGLVYRIEHDGDTWTSKNLAGILGVVLSLDATFSETQIFPPCPVPVCFGASFSLSASFFGEFGGAVAVNSKANLDEQLITKCGFNPDFTGFTIQIRAMVTVYAGIGIKGLFSATVNGYGYLSFLFELKGTHFTHLRISAGFGFYLLLEVVFWHAKFSIWDSPDYDIYDGEWPKASSSGGTQISSLFSSSGQTGDGDAPESLPLTAQDYPDLVPTSTKVADASWTMSTEVQLLEIAGETFAFFIGEMVGDNGTNKVVWLNLATGKSGTFTDTLQAAANRESFVSDPQNTLTNHTLIDQLDKMYAGENAWIYSTNDINFTVGQVEMDDSETLLKSVFSGLYTLTALAADIAQVSDTEIELRSQPRMYIVGFVSDGNHGLTTNLPVPSYYADFSKGPSPEIEFTANPFMSWRMLFSAALQGDLDDLKETVFKRLCAGCVAASTTDNDGYMNQVYHYATLSIGDQVASMTEFMPLTLAANIASTGIRESFLRGGYDCQLDLRQHDANGIQVGIAPPSYEAANTYYYLQDSGTQDEKQLIYHSIYPSDLQKDVNVAFYLVYPEADADHVFYLSPETLPNGQTLYHMHAAKIQHIAAHTCPVYTFTNFDITVPGAYFSVQRVSDTVYVYWTEQHQKKDDKNTIIYYLKAVAYDPGSGIASDDFVLAEFTAPSDQNIKQILLTDQGTGYYVGNDGIYSFPFRMKATMDLDAAVLDHDVVGIGENDTVLVRMVNNGNMAITHFTLTESAVQQDGSLQLVETVTCDTLKPENSVLHLEGDDPKLDIHGEEAIQRQMVNLGKDTQNYWEVKQTVRTFTSRTAYTDEEKEADLEASEILPGQVAAFTMLMETPKSWKESKTWQLQFDLTKYSAVSNLQRSLALRHGLLDEEEIDAPQTLTWVRSAGGTMKLENAAALNASGRGPVYAEELPAPDSAAVDISLNNLVVDHRVYVTPEGERRVSMTIHNDANLFGSIRISCEVRLDDSDTPFYLDLPYDPDSMAANRTHTIDFPVSALSGGRKDAKKAEVTIRGIDIEEWILLDNSFTVKLSDGDPLRIIVQPQSQTVNAGDSVKLFVQAAGGVPPYHYQWQEYVNESQGWRDIAGATDSELNLTPGKDVSWYRCIVSDLNQDSVLSDTAEITLRKRLPLTGDRGPDLWVLPVAALLLAAWFLLKRAGKRRENG